MTPELIQKYDLEIIPLLITIGDNTYYDSVDINPAEMFAMVEKTGNTPTTAAPSQQTFTDVFTKYLNEGYDEILYMGIGSKMSATYNIARLVAEEIAPDKIFVANSNNLSTGSSLSLLKAIDMINEGKSCKEIVDYIDNNYSKRVRASFVIDVLDYMHRGGRCSTLALIASGVLKIKPRIYVTDGKAVSGEKYRGKYEKCLKEYLNDTLAATPKIDKTRIFITACMCEQSDYDMAYDAIKDMGFKEILQTKAGCVISAHCGPRTLGILFVEEE